MFSVIMQMHPYILEIHSAQRKRGTGVRRVRSATWMCSYHTLPCFWLEIRCQSSHSVCQLAWLAPSSQWTWAHSAASWQSRPLNKEMVQTWHTFKKFSLPSPNPLHCRQGWHVPNENKTFVWENSPPLTGIVSPKTTRSPMKGNRFCCFFFYLRNFRKNPSFVPYFFTLFGLFVGCSWHRHGYQFRWNKNRTDDSWFLDFFPGTWPHFRRLFCRDWNLRKLGNIFS